jgi:two-component system nitrate/nitrite response regulator NarL
VSATVRTLVVEERTLLREGLTSLLEDTHYEVIAAAGCISEIGKEHLEDASLVVFGILSGMDKTIAAIRRLRNVLPRTKLFIVAEGSEPCDSQALLRNGAAGCILDVASREVLIKSLDLALLQQRLIVIGHSGRFDQGQPVSKTREIPAPVSNEVGKKFRSRKLSLRERQILACLARGDSNKAIARHCYIAETTVKAHLKAILRKIAVQNRTQAAIWAIDHGLVAADTGEDTISSAPLPSAP